MTTLTREDVIRIIEEACARGITLDLRWADLRGADLRGADLRGADLRGADLHGADLRGADLRGADLRWADLRGADLRGADLHGADLREADLRWADLRGADLRGADLHGADLREANGVFGLGRTPSGLTDLRPLPNGTWQITVGCFKGTTSELRAVITSDDWPSECGEEERDRRRPILTALADYADAIAAYHPHLLDATVKKWSNQ